MSVGRRQAGAKVPVTVVVPTFSREEPLVSSLAALRELLGEGDDVLVVDQTPVHEDTTERFLELGVREGWLRWYRRTTPSQCEAMNVAALIAEGEILLFLDDDIDPGNGLLDGHRRVLADEPGVPATCGQVLQPWHDGPLREVADFETGFDAAYAKRCDVLSLMEGNFAMRRGEFIALGGMDENFKGATYRHGMELAYRILARTGHRPAFIPEASLRHLWAGGGNRAYGAKDSWSRIEGSVGDYYFAMKSLSLLACLRHCLRRLAREPVNRQTIRRPWRVAVLVVREVVAWWKALYRLIFRPHRGIRPPGDYEATRMGTGCEVRS